MDSTTAEPAATTDACVYCRRTDVPVKPNQYTGRLGCDACTELVDVSMTRRLAAAAAPELPAEIEAKAQDAGLAVTVAYREEWRAEMRAYANEAAEENPKPAAWLAEDPCPSWCEDRGNHRASDAPADRIHFGRSGFVKLVTMEPVVVAYPERFEQPELTVSLEQAYREKEPRVFINDAGDKLRMMATLTEAEAFATEILAMVAEARGRRLALVEPLFDDEGRCPDPLCAKCHPLLDEIEGASA